ncbi:MAG TPA: hypothetical protein VMY42_20085 [Thermoguttaceae bacterium]|nr:hypothetical protein [Thermoguttaceae bacterium]
MWLNRCRVFPLSGKPEGPFTRSYLALCRDKKLVPRFEMRNQIQVTLPGGTFGAYFPQAQALQLRGETLPMPEIQ